MSNLLAVLPEFDLAPFSHILPSLERASISSADLLTLDALDVAKRAQVPPAEVKKLANALIAALHSDTLRESNEDHENWPISTLDDDLDQALGGGVASGYLTEIVGESGAGKTQFLLTLLLSAQLPKADSGRDGKPSKRAALYISTEAPLQTSRLAQILKTHPKLCNLPADQRPSLSHIHSTHVHDVVAQDHILTYQVPVAIAKHGVGLLVIDSIAANYRAEFDKGGSSKSGRVAGSLLKRNNQIAQTGALLLKLARTHGIAVVMANQVSDRFSNGPEPSSQVLKSGSQASQYNKGISMNPNVATSTMPGSLVNVPHPELQDALELFTDDPLAFDHQQRFFTGWGDDPTISVLKTPSLGLTLTNQLSARIALLMEPIYRDKVYRPGEERELARWQRRCKVVFSAWCAESTTAFEIWEGGIRSVRCAAEPGIGTPAAKGMQGS